MPKENLRVAGRMKSETRARSCISTGYNVLHAKCPLAHRALRDADGSRAGGHVDGASGNCKGRADSLPQYTDSRCVNDHEAYDRAWANLLAIRTKIKGNRMARTPMTANGSLITGLPSISRLDLQYLERRKQTVCVPDDRRGSWSIALHSLLRLLLPCDELALPAGILLTRLTLTCKRPGVMVVRRGRPISIFSENHQILVCFPSIKSQQAHTMTRTGAEEIEGL